MDLSPTALYIFAIALLGFGAVWFVWRQDEIPLLLAGFNALFIRRLFVVEDGYADWISFDFGLSFTFDYYVDRAGTYLLLGTVLAIFVYCLFHKSPAPLRREDENALKDRLWKHRLPIICGFLIFTVLCTMLRVSFDGDLVEMMEASSYAYLFSLAYSGFIVMLFLVLVLGGRENVIERVILVGAVIITAFWTVGPSLRFSFLGWAPALLIIATRHLSPVRRLIALAAIGLMIAFIFTMSGVRRNPDMENAGVFEIAQEAVQSSRGQSDANMLDGLIMVLQVFPTHMEYRYGMEHLEIFTRPIPRSWWPEKPVGGWQQRFAQESGMAFFSTGISPSMYGSFFMEGGLLGIIIFSALYGWLFACYTNWANSYRSSMRWLLRSLLISSLFAIIRGGDMPGIAAFIGMSYWPAGVFLWYFHRVSEHDRQGDQRFAGVIRPGDSRK